MADWRNEAVLWEMKCEATGNSIRRGVGLRGDLGASGRHEERSQAAKHLELERGGALRGMDTDTVQSRPAMVALT